MYFPSLAGPLIVTFFRLSAAENAQSLNSVTVAGTVISVMASPSKMPPAMAVMV